MSMSMRRIGVDECRGMEGMEGMGGDTGVVFMCSTHLIGLHGVVFSTVVFSTPLTSCLRLRIGLSGLSV